MNDFKKKITFTQKTYIWSTIFEPLMFFVLIEAQNVLAGPITVSRLLQLSVILIFFFRVINLLKIKLIHNSFSSLLNKYITFLIIYIIIVLFLGFLSNHYTYNELEKYWSGPLVYEGLLGKQNIRPIFEIVLFVYYFVYFVIVPKYIFISKYHLNYFFNYFFKIAFAVIFLGLIDVSSNYFFAVDLIPRHLVDNRWVHMTWRFHSFCGEARDAVVYLFFLIAIYSLHSAIIEKKMDKKIICIILLCAFLTLSMSGYLGFMLAFLILIFTRFKLKHFLISVISGTLFFLLIFYLMKSGGEHGHFFYRLEYYYRELLQLPILLHTTGKLPEMLNAQGPDIYPIWIMWIKLKSNDLFYVLFGHGFGSASFAVNNYSNYFAGLNNPRSNLVRFLFELGFLGSFFYFYILAKPIYKIKKIINESYFDSFFVASVLLFASTLAHRSNAYLIFIGIIVAIIVNKNITSYKNKSK